MSRYSRCRICNRSLCCGDTTDCSFHAEGFCGLDEKFDTTQPSKGKLTQGNGSGTIDEFSTSVFSWLMGTTAGVPAKGGDRAETPLLDLVRAGIENDFERVVFPEYPELREVKRVLEREGAQYASLVWLRVDVVWTVRIG